ncbi:hypothetical protein CALVIDRAFT_541979 [Calocera viscosa TUFC12733]|uniref:Uncharacterized protein n=1 Tax=Calocera viscosa (strain TUFC12733) TaxID=1330018 RepID=A0A167H4U6_CALVF|nr:hypothetical protein CALVIDRAFT_541979 [Calocera viscosa TUFC12733]
MRLLQLSKALGLAVLLHGVSAQLQGSASVTAPAGNTYPVQTLTTSPIQPTTSAIAVGIPAVN